MESLKQSIVDRLVILRASIVYTFQQETAYWSNNWANILSTTFYTISMILFVEVIYSNVNVVAGYDRNQMLLFLFVGQVSYYSSWMVYSNLKELIVDVNKGNLDLLLVKPTPSLFYVTFKHIKVFSILRDSIPPMAAIALITDWGALNLGLVNVLTGTLIAFLGIITAHVIHFIATIPVFWLGESRAIQELSEHIEYNVGKIIPLEGYGQNFQIFFSTLLPVLISTGFATSVMLEKSNPGLLLAWSLVVAIFALFVRNILWKKALKAYTSASS